MTRRRDRRQVAAGVYAIVGARGTATVTAIRAAYRARWPGEVIDAETCRSALAWLREHGLVYPLDDWWSVPQGRVRWAAVPTEHTEHTGTKGQKGHTEVDHAG